MVYFFIIVLGLAFGSFLNVCIYRLPFHLSVVRPRSYCPRCHHPLRWYDEIPLLSFVFLRGRCRDCGEPISLRYPLVEALTAALLLMEYARDGWSLLAVRNALLIMMLLVILFTDLLERQIPHRVTIPGIIAGLAFSMVVPVDSRPLDMVCHAYGLAPSAALLSLGGAVTGALAGGGFFYVVGTLFFWIRRVEGLGFGDVMLMLMVGTYLGVPLTLTTILAGSILSLLVALPFVLLDRQRYWRFAWPYGSFLSAAAIYLCLRGEDLLESYLRVAGLKP